MTPDDPSTRARSLLTSVSAEPTVGDVAALRDLVIRGDRSERSLGLEAMQIVASRDPALLTDQLEDDVERICELCGDDDPRIRANAIGVLAAVAAGNADLEDEALSVLAALLSDDSRVVRQRALVGIHRIGSAAPAALPPLVDDVAPFLDEDAEGNHRQIAVKIVSLAATAEGASVAPHAPRLLECFVSDAGDAMSSAASDRPSADAGEPRSGGVERWKHARSMRALAGHALCQLAVDEPDVVASAVDDVVDVLDDPDVQLRILAGNILVVLSGERPEVVAPYVETVAERLGSDRSTIVTARCAQVLASTSQVAPSDVTDDVCERIDAIAPLLDHDEAPVRGSAAALLALVAREAPDRVVPLAGALRALLDDEDYVSEAAADALSQCS